MKLALLSFTVLMVFALPAAAQTGGTPADDGEIRSIALRWEDAWNRHDMKALVALVAADGDMITVAGTWLRSRGEFEADHARSHQSVLKESVLTTSSTEVTFIRPDVAVVHVGWGIQGVKEQDGRPRPPQRGISTWVVEKRSAGWLILAGHNTLIREHVPVR